MNRRLLGISLLMSTAFLISCGEDGKSSKTGASCSETADCGNSDLICYNSLCIPRCPATPCQSGSYCADNGLCIPVNSLTQCSDAAPCQESGKTCVEGYCVPAPECSENSQCSSDGSKVCVSGNCISASEVVACSNLNPCEDSEKICKQGLCVDFVEPSTCYSDSECKGSRICDAGKCLPANGCSRTRRCPENFVCRNNTCVEWEEPECSRVKSCADQSKTCVAGKCIQCSCQNNEICNYDGSCSPALSSSDGTIVEGAECNYPDDIQKSCDGNHYFSCSMLSGGDDKKYTFSVTQCGGDICAYTSEEMLQCNEPCTQEGDFFGECYNDYNSESGTYQPISFLQICEKSPEGLLYWTYSQAPQYCKGGCTNGSCDFVPEDYGQSCTKGVYEDKCQGDWLLFCDSTSTYQTVVYGENCKTSYSPEHYCEFSESGDSSCVIPCESSELNTVKNQCNSIYNGIYSESWKCEKTRSGDYAWFLQNYEECKSSCIESTGQCK